MVFIVARETPKSLKVTFLQLIVKNPHERLYLFFGQFYMIVNLNWEKFNLLFKLTENYII